MIRAACFLFDFPLCDDFLAVTDNEGEDGDEELSSSMTMLLTSKRHPVPPIHHLIVVGAFKFRLCCRDLASFLLCFFAFFLCLGYSRGLLPVPDCALF